MIDEASRPDVRDESREPDNLQSPDPSFIQHIFSQLAPQHVEQFYHSYQLWQLQQKHALLSQQIAQLQLEIATNEREMLQVAPSALALASLAQLQASGVTDIILLERMLERGETWLDHTLQLLIRCERLDLIGGDYNEWCTLSLEGAYDWIESIYETDDELEPVSTTDTADSQTTADLLLRKLMSDEDDTALLTPIPQARITRPLSPPIPQARITRPLSPPIPQARITRPLSAPDDLPDLSAATDAQPELTLAPNETPTATLTSPNLLEQPAEHTLAVDTALIEMPDEVIPSAEPVPNEVEPAFLAETIDALNSQQELSTTSSTVALPQDGPITEAIPTISTDQEHALPISAESAQTAPEEDVALPPVVTAQQDTRVAHKARTGVSKRLRDFILRLLAKIWRW